MGNQNQAEIDKVGQLLSLKLTLLKQLLEIGNSFNEVVKQRQVELSDVDSLTRQHGALVDNVQQLRGEWDVLFPKSGDFQIWRRGLDGKVREGIDEVRNEIRDLMIEIRALNQGAQTTLIYTTNFYASFLEGLLADGPVHSSYSSKGVVRPTSSGLLQADC